MWSHGTLNDMPYQVNGEKAHGPGIYDMKAGSFLAFHAVRSILRQKVPTRRPIVLLLTPDEEVGSPTSREWIEREASRGRLRADPGARRQGWRLRHRAQGRRPVRHAGGRPRRAFRRRVRGGRIGRRGTGAADRAPARHGGPGSRHHAERRPGVGRIAAERDLARCRLRDRPAGELDRRRRTHGAHAAGDARH